MRIAITGATGMIGSRLTDFFSAQGHQVTRISRRFITDHEEAQELEGVDAVIHLAGANIAKYWSPEYKKEILESRVGSTKFLCERLARAVAKPKILITASAIGFYGSHPPEEIVDETSPMGSGFLADVCQQWEEPTRLPTQVGIRVVRLRLGVVLGKTGGALAQMRLPFQLGIGGVLGSGRQMMSWVALDEIPLVIEYLIKNEAIRGPVNVVSPQAVSNACFTKVLGELMHRPTLLPVPAFAIGLLFGEMGQNLLLEGVHAVPRRLQESGYNFRFADLKDALKTCLI